MGGGLLTGAALRPDNAYARRPSLLPSNPEPFCHSPSTLFAAAGDCGYLAANLYAKSVFGEVRKGCV